MLKGVTMKNFNHLTLEDRIVIEKEQDKSSSFKAIAALIGKSFSAISKEIRKHLQLKRICPGSTILFPHVSSVDSRCIILL